MTQDQPITIFADSITRQAIELHINRLKLEDICHFESHMENVVILRYDSNETLYEMPIRMGQIIDQINRFKSSAIKNNSAILTLGNNNLDINSGTFYRNYRADNEVTVQLTEKEVELLCYLYKKKDHTVSREELLNTIWGYAKNVETHTLETHIYRLRQKIEQNPAEPLLLKKEENGYFLDF